MYQILVAEDEAAQRQALCDCLEKQLGDRCTILTAACGTEAVTLFEQHRPRVAVLDIEMPDISGLEVARRIRQSDGVCGIIFLTASERFSDAREAIWLRAMDCLPKPWSEQELVLSVEEALRLTEACATDSALHLLTGACRLTERERESIRLERVRENIESFIRDHYDTELSMQDVARAMNYSDAYFCKLFKQCFQVNFSAYLNAYRVARARELLSNTRLNIREVSLACGYSDSNYFSRVFKRITGMTPSEYRVV